ncbi:MAG: hypothetical protein RIM99_06040 [Cyclobacteriaceae bacterium]
MKTPLFLCTLFLCLNICAQQYCDDYTEASEKLTAEKKRFNNSLTPEMRNSVKAQASVTGFLMEKCYESRPNNKPQDILERKYRLGKMFRDAEEWPKAKAYFEACRNDSQSKAYSRKGRTYYELAREMIKALPNQMLTTNSTGSGVTVTYSGKGGYVEEIQQAMKFESADNFSYTSDELEDLMDSRRRISEGADESYLSELKNKASSELIEVNGPFVVINGNARVNTGGQETSQMRTERLGLAPNTANSLKALYQHIEGRYMNSIPEYFIPVYLSTASFSRDGYLYFSDFARKIHGRGAGGRVAYYNSIDNSIVCWISTGGGTLNHEAVHALLTQDYPDIPGWLNEGIAAMYEETGTAYQPLDNYRLIHLQRAERYGVFPTLQQLTGIEDEAYDGRKETMLYAAAARYLAMYLNERGVLPTVYKQIRESGNQSAAGRKSMILSSLVMSENDFNQQWRQWITNKTVPAKWEGLTGQIDEYIQSLAGEADYMVSAQNSATFIENRDGRSWYKWSVYVSADQNTLNQIDHVQYVLHPTFANPVIDVYEGRSEGFPLTRTGWGTFEVGVNVYFKNGSVKKLLHDLKFN